MNTLFNLFLITLVVCFIIDCSGFIDDGLKPLVARFVNRKSTIKVKPEDISIPKPFSCSLCLTFWTGIIYICIIGEFTFVNLFIVSMLALLSSNISGFMFLIKDILATIENWLQKLIS